MPREKKVIKEIHEASFLNPTQSSEHRRLDSQPEPLEIKKPLTVRLTQPKLSPRKFNRAKPMTPIRSEAESSV